MQFRFYDAKLRNLTQRTHILSPYFLPVSINAKGGDSDIILTTANTHSEISNAQKAEKAARGTKLTFTASSHGLKTPIGNRKK